MTSGHSSGSSGPGLPARRPPPPALIPERDRADLQGFITSSFGHLPEAAYLFVRFAGAEAARRWLRDIRPGLTTARAWRSHAGAPKRPPAKTLNLAFTAAGLRALELAPPCLESFPREFLQGMATPDRSRDLGDAGESAPDKWQFGNDRAPVHALAILCAASPEEIQIESGLFQRRLADVAQGTLVAREDGRRPPDDREHFGFHDGIAQTSILGIQKQGVRAGEFILGYENEYGYHPVSPSLPAALDPEALLRDSPNPYRQGERDFGRHGSFLVYRKLEQNVAAFWKFMAAESVRRHGRPDARFMIWLAAKMVGRWPGGAPLTLSPDDDDPTLAAADDFFYAETDGEGLRCPLGAHIRRTNPRDHLRPAGPVESLHMTARHRIIRRGRPYGPRLFDPELLDRSREPEAGAALASLREDAPRPGLHFLCLCASIKSQFEFIQQAWSNNPRTNGLIGNPDPMASAPPVPGLAGSMSIPQDGLDTRTAGLPVFVTVRAGAYLFLPGLSAFDYLASEARTSVVP